MKRVTLTKKQWLQVADNIGTVAKHLAKALIDMNVDGVGKEDAEEMQADMMAAYTAVMYVAEFAADKCVFVGVKETGQEDEDGTE